MQKEIEQPHNKLVLRPMEAKKFSRKYKLVSLQALMFLK